MSAQGRACATARLVGCEQPLATAYDVALLDLDGVVYLGAQPVPGAASALADARERGMRTAFVTNNASRSPAAVAAHLRELGVDATATDIVTSAQAAARLLREHLPAGATVLVVGTEALRAEVRAVGLRIVESSEDDPAGVVQGFDPATTYRELAEATLAVAGGALWVASNGDRTLPSPRGRVPGNGALVAAVATATDRRPLVAGKPQIALHRESVDRTSARRPLVVGDRLDTDIEGACRGGNDSLLVFTGVATPADVVRAGPQQRPSYLAADLYGLLRAHPAAVAAPDSGGLRTQVGRWRARAAGGVLELDRAAGEGADGRAPGAGDPRPPGPEPSRLDAIRAGCVAAWAAADSGTPVRRLRVGAGVSLELARSFGLDPD